MSPEIPILDSQRAAKFVLGLPCPRPGCDGNIQTYETSSCIRATCYKCGYEINLSSVKIIYEEKEGGDHCET